ncbi:MAG: tetratricopeptide repeat protein, partial [Leptolyngbyaceae cyanobacterium SM1_3_5]|nr:tetratricopeptide repeat protein [Leptolyngbyaceae cyanobacterium SM1_3_5]
MKPSLTPTPNWTAIDAIEQAQSLCDQQQWSEVTRLCQQTIASLEPATATTYRLMGWALQAQGHLDEAEIFYAKAIAIQPDLPETTPASAASTPRNATGR